MRACVSPPHDRTSHIVVTTPSIAQAASTALPPFWNIMAPAVAPRGLPVIAIQCRAWSGGFCVRSACAGAAASHSSPASRQARERDLVMTVPPRAAKARPSIAPPVPGALRPRDAPSRRASERPRRALLAAVAAAILAREALPLRRRAENLAPLAVLEHDLIAAGEDLERPLDLLQMVERHRARLVRS